MTSKGTPRRTIRIADEIWKPAEERATREGHESLAEVIRQQLTQYGQNETEQNK